jgi:hypothetical protein
MKRRGPERRSIAHSPQIGLVSVKKKNMVTENMNILTKE